MHDDQASLMEQLRTARFDADAQREMKVTARKQRDRVTRLLTRAIQLLGDIQSEFLVAPPNTSQNEFSGQIDLLVDQYYKRKPETSDE